MADENPRIEPRRPRLQLRWLVLALALLAACAKPVGVKRVDARSVHRHLTRNVLTSGEPSAPSQQVLYRLALDGRFETDPEAALAELHESLGQSEDPNRLFALAELSFLYADRSGKQPYHLAAALYAYAFLFPEDPQQRPRGLDPRLRLAADLYNRGLTGGLAAPDGEEVILEPRSLRLPFGQLDFEVDPRDFEWGSYRLVRFFPLAEFEVQGLSNRYRRPGIGAPLAADFENATPNAQAPASYRRIPKDVSVPVTALLRIAQPRRQLLVGQVRGKLELYTSEDVESVRVGGETLALEYESSSSLAAALQGSRFTNSSVLAFFGRARLFGEREDGLLMLQPYKAGLIPVVLVHGTASSPAWWAEMLNELGNDPKLRDAYQFWLFRYDTGNPILYSSHLLRQALRNTVAELDPAGTDAALRQMVLIGHSQGGLLVKLSVVNSGAVFWEPLSDEPIEDLDLSPASRELLRETLFIEPLPFVKRVVFIATPHRGSFRATPGLGDLLAGTIVLPVELATLPLDLLRRDPESKLARQIEKMPTSIKDMTPGDPFLENLAALPIAEGVEVHSIIAVRGTGPIEKGDDGVVKYESAHLEGVASEFVVRSSHSTQTHPLTIGEVDRILREHLE